MSNTHSGESGSPARSPSMMTCRRWVTSSALPGAATPIGSTRTTAVSVTISKAAQIAAQVQMQPQPVEHRPGGVDQDAGPQQRREERIQHQHAADRHAAQQQAHQNPFSDHASPSAIARTCSLGNGARLMSFAIGALALFFSGPLIGYIRILRLAPNAASVHQGYVRPDALVKLVARL